MNLETDGALERLIRCRVQMCPVSVCHTQQSINPLEAHNSFQTPENGIIYTISLKDVLAIASEWPGSEKLFGVHPRACLHPEGQPTFFFFCFQNQTSPPPTHMPQLLRVPSVSKTVCKTAWRASLGEMQAPSHLQLTELVASYTYSALKLGNKHNTKDF